MAFDGTEGDVIDIDKAGDWTGNHRTNNSSDPTSHFFGKDILNDILGQSGCMGIRIYRAEKGTGDKVLVLVGVDSEENDMLGENDTIAEYGPVGPPDGSTNALNS